MRRMIAAIVLAAALAGPAYAQTEQPWPACVNEGRSLASAEARDACTQIIESGRESRRNRAIAHFNRAGAHLTLGDAEAALADYSRAIDLGLAEPDVYYGRGIANFALRRHGDALADYSEAVLRNPNYAEAYGSLGNLYQYGLGDFDRAIEDYNRALALRENAADLHNRGNAYQYGRMDYALAMADYNASIALDPNVAAAFIDRGNAFLNQSDMTAAIADYSEALRLQPGFTQALYNRGNAYSYTNDMQRAFADWSAAIDADPMFADALGNRGGAYFNRGDYDLALADLDRALAIRADAADFHIRGLVYQDGRNDLPRAIQDFDEAVRMSPGDADFNNDNCWARTLANLDLDRARSLCDAAIAAEPSPDYYDSRGLVGLRQERLEDAWNDYNMAVHAEPANAHYLYGRGVAALRLGRTEEGQADLARASALSADIAATYAEYGVSP